MIYKNWMSYIKDEVKLTSLVIPGSHNSGSYEMHVTGRCQRHDIYTQFSYGIRHFCMRVDTDKKGQIIMRHGPTKGGALEKVLLDFKRIIEEYPQEFLIIDLREYYTQTIIGKWKLRYYDDPAQMDMLLEKYLEPEKNAFTEFDDISAVTVGQIRKSGKKFLLVNYRQAYKYSVNCPLAVPWDKYVYGMPAQKFAETNVMVFDKFKTNGLYWFQTQQTPNLGTEIGYRTPGWLDKLLRPYFYRIIESIVKNPSHLERANIISGDFMTHDYLKSRQILELNILKGNVYDKLITEYLLKLWRAT